jgi:hypothetical protein
MCEAAEAKAMREIEEPGGEDGGGAPMMKVAATGRKQMTTTDPEVSNSLATTAGSNSLADLAARIRAEHEATSTALKSSAEHGIAAGELLIEAKAKVPHGQWLPWLKDNCSMSERTAQLYMRLAKNREAVEDQIRNGDADLSLNEATALLMLSSDVRKLFEMVKTMEGLQGDDLINFCVANDIGMLTGNIFNAPTPTDQEEIEWRIFVLWLVRVHGHYVESALLHMEWVQSRGTLLADWMKPNPLRDAWMPIPQATFDNWHTFLEANRGRSLDDVKAEIMAVEKSQGEMPRPSLRKRRKRVGRG